MEVNIPADDIQFFQQTILAYWREHGRHDLPWRNTNDPWELLMAEILLRKTTSAQAMTIFEKLRSFSSDDIIKMETSVLEVILEPIGLNKVRAGQLKEAALAVSSASEEQLQSDVFLQSIRGVGRYISNMVRCCAFGVPAPALDTNLIRIVQRVFGYISIRKRAREDRQLWEFANQLVPPDSPREFNWGVLDFGAEVCTFYHPKCSVCPMQRICRYYKASVLGESS